MLLKEIFKKPVDRQIEGVIKADDEAGLKNEIEEYVLTNEVSKRLDSFLEAYNNYQGANGAWLSGFFGSGKSHLLKMLALLLENRQVESLSVKEMFISKCGEDRLLQAKIEKAASIPSKSILFNIDQKADVIRKDQVDALLSVFVKVFDEMCGYYGKQPFIAQFERDLDSREELVGFKASYERISGKSWEKGRQEFALEKKNIDKAYAETVGDKTLSNNGILDSYRTSYKLSIEDFAEQINSYIGIQEKNFRLNFFVDEVGQYIADNVKLMTNLQTIAESLATKCNGRAWVIVTAQEDMNSIIGDMTKQQGNDFSKIQARFSNRLKLTSADVAEVIQIRLLSKTDSSKKDIETLYDKQVNNFKTLFDFADGSKVYKNFRDKEHFVSAYPFIPYQFDLFQSSIQHLSIHNAFEGKHSSVGERSMLGVFQQVAKQIVDKEIGKLATFDLMFEGLRTALKAQIQSAIIVAERNLDNKFAVQLLKALFLVKYVKDFKTTVRNLCVLMYDSFERDIPTLKKEIETALLLLEQQTYIQRNGDVYEFLTNDEKDIEEEIKSTEVDNQQLLEDLTKTIFDSIIGTRKIRYDVNGYDYEFARKLDDKLMGREKELAIHVISPFHEHSGNDQVILTQSFAKSELMVILPPDERLVKDLMLHQKTNRYIRQNTNTAQQESISRILREKGDQNHRRFSDVEDRVRKLLSEAKLSIGSDLLDISAKDPKTRISEAFIELIRKSYPQLQMLKGTNYSEQQISILLSPSSQVSFSDDLIESEQEVLSAIQRSSMKGTRMTVKSLITDFEIKPYGWHQAATQCTLAKLCTRGKVELRLDGNLLEGQDLERAIVNSQLHQQVIIESQAEFTSSQVRQLKDFYKDFFDEQPKSQEAKALAKDTIEKFKELGDDLKKLVYQREQFPFLSILSPISEKIDSITKKQYSFFLTSLSEIEDELLDAKEKIIAPIKTFMAGSQKDIYKEAKNFLLNESENFDFIEKTELSELDSILRDTVCFAGNKMKRVKEIVDLLKARISDLVVSETEKAKCKIESFRDRVKMADGYNTLSAVDKENVEHIFSKSTMALKDKHLVASIKHAALNFETNEYNSILSMIEAKKHQAAGEQTGETKPLATQKINLIQVRNLTLKFDKPVLDSESDVEEYIRLLREALVNELKQGNKIQI
ncbi:MAG: BREX system P-loop protein BrxC [Bdellovibrionales bacterium CG10_big_fil_rev_8_21_14_0_10_45_34]|nr:MAG: BREX system P-loop protein BrxC [Bdellovibrionales bacterium CG10_big_fil_rev_8_21_14_0_10_45_34]